jgi:hypothetical protein
MPKGKTDSGAKPMGRGTTWDRETRSACNALTDSEQMPRLSKALPNRSGSRILIPFIAALVVVCWSNAAVPEASQTGEWSPRNKAGLMALLPSGDDLGTGWSNRVTSLVDRGSPELEYFHPEIREPARELIRSHVPQGAAFCDVSYFRGSHYVFDAWLRRLESTNLVETEWNNLRQTRLLPRLSDGKVFERSVRRVGDLEAILYTGDSRTLWMASGQWILNLNLHAKMSLDEVFSIAEVFARQLTAGQSAPARPIEGRSSTEEAGWYAVNFAEGAYTTVRRVHTNRVAMSRAFRKPDNVHAYFTITNAESVPILLWNVRVQVKTNGSEGNPDGWKTVSSGSWRGTFSRNWTRIGTMNRGARNAASGPHPGPLPEG